MSKILIVLILSLPLLTACGKRANMVSAPPDLVNDTFPRAYPDPATDPGGVVRAPTP